MNTAQHIGLTPIKRFCFRWLIAAICCVCFSGSVSAGICFLPDCEGQKGTQGRDTGAETCIAAGFESDKSVLCNQYSIVTYCPQNSSFIKCNDQLWCSVNGYTNTSCTYPNELFNKCPNGLAMYKECKPNMEAVCKNENASYVNSCPAGWTLDPKKSCSYSNEWGKCCNMCPGYEYTEATLPAGSKAVASCESCDGTRYIAGKDLGNVCEGFWDCQDGCEIGSETCTGYNGVIKCKICKRCEAKCSNLSCPYGAFCEYENCTQRYCAPNGCAVGYTYLCREIESRDCTALGYVTAKASCLGMGIVECPFDRNKVWCIPDDGTCCSSQCAGFEYEYSEIPSGYVQASSCKCCGKTLYKIKENTCTGYVSSEECAYGPKDGTLTCKQGEKTFYKECKACPGACTHWFCPAGTICTQDSCSKTYCPTGCATGYKYYCKTPTRDCEVLGYKTITAYCSNRSVMKCPYDQEKVFCM